MKRILCLLLICFTGFPPASAQLIKPLKQPAGFGDSLSKIIVDFKNNFRQIQGQKILTEGATDVYVSNTCLPDALHCTVTQYRSKEDPSSSWQALMYEGEDYKQALKCYRKTFSLVKKSPIRGIQRSNGYFDGTLESPAENVPFAVSSLKLFSSENLYDNFYAEVEMVNTYTGWEVHLNLHEKKPDELK